GGSCVPRLEDLRAVPAGSWTSVWKRDRLDVEPAPSEQPRDGRIGIPHLARAQFVTPPDRRRHVRRELDQPTSAVQIIADTVRALDRLVGVRDDAVFPAPNLVAEEGHAAEGSGADRSLGDDAALALLPPHWRLLDDEAPLLRPYLELRVIEIASASPSEQRGGRLVDLAVQSDRMAACAQGEPVEVDSCRHLQRDFTPSAAARHRR